MNKALTPQTLSPKDIQNRMIELLTPILNGLGYQIVYLEAQVARQKKLVLFIDHLKPEIEPRTHENALPLTQMAVPKITVDDCAKVSRALDEPLDKIPEVDALFHGPFELEVSSPGVERPLRDLNDFNRFSGKRVRIHLFRPLTAEEISNGEYQKKNPKQKNFLGILGGVESENINLILLKEKIKIPYSLISKANLEPDFEAIVNRERE